MKFLKQFIDMKTILQAYQGKLVPKGIPLIH